MPQIINGKKVLDPNNAEDMKILDEIGKKQLAAFEATEKPLNLNVTVDSKQMEELISEKAELKKELAKANGTDLSAMQEFFDAEKTKASEKLTALGIETSPDSIRGKDDLDRANKTIQALQRRENIGSNIGGTPLSLNQINGNAQQQQTFSSPKELVSHLYENKAENKAVIDKLWEKSLNGQKQSGNGFNLSEAEMLPSEIMARVRQVRKSQA